MKVFHEALSTYSPHFPVTKVHIFTVLGTDCVPSSNDHAIMILLFNFIKE